MSTVLFKRGSTSDMNDTNIQDGLLFFNTETYKIYMDNGTERIQYGGDTDLISSAEDASLTNAFNAETSLGLFSQKATVVDSKQMHFLLLKIISLLDVWHLKKLLEQRIIVQ